MLSLHLSGSPRHSLHKGFGLQCKKGEIQNPTALLGLHLANKDNLLTYTQRLDTLN